MKVLVFGGCSWDTLIHVPEIKSLEDDMSLWASSVAETVGGTGAGKALCLDALGHDVIFVTKIGRDESGRKILDFLSNTNIQVINLGSDISTTHTNLMHSEGKRISVFTSVANSSFVEDKRIEDFLSWADIVFLNINEFCRGYIDLLSTTKKTIVVDIHDYDPPNPYHADFIEVADIITASGVYIKDCEMFLRSLIDRGKTAVTITNGSEGSITMDSEYNTYKISGYNDFDYIDSNGAGDSFCSSYATQYMLTGDIGESLKYGTICGGIACTTYDLFNVKYNDKAIKDILKKELI